MNEYSIRIDNLKKSYGEVRALDGISFEVARGSLFAFLGENGAGKSTTINIMCGSLQKDSGTVTVDGYDLDRDGEAIKRSIGVVFQHSVLDRSLSVYDNLCSRAALYGITGKAFRERLASLVDLLDFEGLLKRPLAKLSGGQRRRIDIARALLHEPHLLILDEPTTGLDPQTRRLLWSVIDGLRREQGMTVFLTTHYMEEAADADHVVILDHGKIAASGTPFSLKSTYTGDFLTLYGRDEEDVKVLGVPYERVGEAYRLTLASTAEATKMIASQPHMFTDYEVTKGKMDDVFLAVTGKKLTESEVNNHE